ncbi:hypothetical protein QYF61_004797 [Mycteria americana]|uniref:Uncharacterized protein n=1 Tax=Mycteria americana TaxID=33587 RepID=A0AAN7RSP5_MYCAM|nr:hypothetical protein QYF61_004797 [Mycteria americana]
MVQGRSGEEAPEYPPARRKQLWLGTSESAPHSVRLAAFDAKIQIRNVAVLERTAVLESKPRWLGREQEPCRDGASPCANASCPSSSPPHRPHPTKPVHKKLGGGTARTADPHWPKGYSIPYGVMLSIETGGKVGRGPLLGNWLGIAWLVRLKQHSILEGCSKQGKAQRDHLCCCLSRHPPFHHNPKYPDNPVHHEGDQMGICMVVVSKRTLYLALFHPLPPKSVITDTVHMKSRGCGSGLPVGFVPAEHQEHRHAVAVVPQQGWRLNHFPGQPAPMLDNPFSEEKFPNIQSKPPLAQLEAISSCPITCYLGEETDPHLATTSFQAKQPQFPQPLLIRLVLQTLHQLRCPSLDTLQHLNVSLVVGRPKLNTVFEVRPHQC